MYCKDLTSYEYHLPFKLPSVLNIGWLDRGRRFDKALTSPLLLAKLSTIVLSEGIFEARVNQIRGVHPCNLCNAHTFQNPFIGSCELWIPGCRAGSYFAAPSLLIHYIQAHAYRPPEEFVESALKLNLNRPFNAQTIYDDLVQANSARI